MNTSKQPSQNRKIEMAKALRAVKSIATEEQFLEVRSILVDAVELSSVDSAVKGLSEEDEFALMCRLMGTATNLVPLEQRPIIRGESQAPDFLARFQPGCSSEGRTSFESAGFRCFVEVKSTTKDTYRIGGKKLRRLRAFCDQFNLPLILAVRFLRFEHAALWVMVEDIDRSLATLSITYGDLTEGGVRNVLWDDYVYLMRSGIYFRAVYDKTSGGAGPKHEDYGTLREFHIVFPADLPVSGEHVEGGVAKYVGWQAGAVSAFFESFHPVEKLAETVSTRTISALVPELQVCTLADMLFNYNHLPRDPAGRVLIDASRILAGTDHDSWLATREYIERIADDLLGSVLFTLGIGDPQEQLRTWHRFGGQA